MPDTVTQNGRISLFISYAHEDRDLCARLIVHLSNLIRQGRISHWYDRELIPGEQWDKRIKEELASAKIVLMLVSPDFIASDYVNLVEVANSMARLNKKEVIVIPVILRPSDWVHTQFGALQALPESGLPITKWKNRDEGFLNVVNGIREVIDNLSVSPVVGPKTNGRVRVAKNLKISRPGIFRYLLDRYFSSLHRVLSNLGTLSKPTETDVLNDYLRDAKANIENEIRHKTYIPLAGKEVSYTPFQGTRGPDPFVPPMQQGIRQVVGLERGGDSASAQIAAVNRSSRLIRNIIKTLLHADEPLVLLGDPGTGKTMTLQQTALVLFDSEIKRLFPKVTLYIRLGEFYVEGRPVTPEDVWNYVKSSVPPEISPYLEELDNAGRLILLFDGMDEMSRERYGEHTEALSIFAASRKGQTKTLFSCRITDFSPKFMHRRLVLLPFSSEQISEYLRRYVPVFPLTIEGQAWSLRKLVKRLLSETLPLEATNPFVLWLLCFQLQQKGSWPASRVELLRFYIEENYRRKAEDLADDEPPFPGIDQALAGWSEIAYTITSLNRGAAITVKSLRESAPQNDIDELIRIGKRCGVLQETTSDEELQIRFEHHRFQEFFNAWYIKHFKTEIDWLPKLDAPRWQETMVNLILMGGGEDAIETLAHEIDRDIEASIRAEYPVADEDEYDLLARYNQVDHIAPEEEPSQISLIEELDNEGLEEPSTLVAPAPPGTLVVPAPPPNPETVVADRIELSSRIVRQAASTSTQVGTMLTDTLKKAVHYLSEHGNPITQVKMMRACQNVPAVDIFQVTQSALNSPINWVRNQALIIVSSSNRDALAVGAHFATRLGYDLANGLLPLRMKAFGKAAAASKRLRNWWCLAVGTSCYFINALLLLATAALTYWLLWESLRRSSISFLGGGIYVAACAVLTMAAIGISIKFDLSRLWLAILGVASGTVGLTLIIKAAEKGFFVALTTTFSLLIVGALLTAFVITPLAVGFHSLALGIYLAASAPVRRSISARSYFAAAWRNCSFRKVFFETAKFGMKYMLFSLIPIGLVLLFAGISWLSEVLRLPFWKPVNMAIVTVALALIIATTVSLINRQIRSGTTVLGYIFGGILTLALTLGAGYLVLLGWGLLTRLLERWIPSIAGSTRMWIVGMILALLITAAILYTLWLFLRKFQFLIPWKRVTTSEPISDWKWKMQFADADAEMQAVLLSQTNHQTLGLTAVEFLIVLEQIEDFITAEPALSTYWDKRDRLEQVLRQERQG